MNIETDIDSSGIFEENFSSESKSDFCNYVEIPSSGFNCLYKAQRFGKWYFLKGLKAEYAQQAQYQDLLRKEFDLTFQFDYPNIVRTISFENDSKIGWCIILEYIDGQSLAEFSKTKVFTSNHQKIIDEILQSLSYIHSKQIIHRDLKPENIFITTNGSNVKIIDFGLADADYYTNLKLPSGTEKYVAPEQLTNPKNIDNRADIYSFGKMLLALPLPRYYKSVAKKCANIDREKRYKNVQEIRDAIAFAKRIRVIIPFLIFTVCVGIFIFYNIPNKHKEISIQTTDSVTNTETVTPPIDTTIVDEQNSLQSKIEEKASQSTKHKQQFDLQAVQKNIDKLYQPLLDSLEQQKFHWHEDALRSYTKIQQDLVATIWLPIKESGVFATEREEYEAWQKVVPHMNEVNQQVVDYLKELPLLQENAEFCD